MSIQPDVSVPGLLAAADEAVAQAAFCTGEFGEAERLFTEARTLAAREQDRAGEAMATGGLGMVGHHRNLGLLISGNGLPEADIAAEEGLMARALTLWQEAGDPAGTAMGLFGMSLVHQVLRRDWTVSMPYLWQAFGLAEAVADSGDLYGCSEIHRHLGFYYLVEDVRPAEAVRQLGHSLALRERIGDPRRIPSGLVALGEAELAAGCPDRAVVLLTRAVTLARQAGLLPWRIQDAAETLQQAEAAAR